MGMNRALVGREYSKLDPVDITADAARAYADATNANIAAYPGVAPPMYGVAFTFAALGAPLFDPDLQVDMMRLLPREHDLTVLPPLEGGDVLTAKSQNTRNLADTPR